MRKLSSVGAPKSDTSHKQKIHSGYLYKQGTMFSKKFQKRYFILYEGKILQYYASEISTKDCKGEINLSMVISINESKVKNEDNDKNAYKHVFEMVTKDRTYQLAAEDIKSMNTWMDYIRSSVFGTKIHEGWLTKQGDFVKSWKRRYFVLTDTKLLRYFEDDEQTKFKGIINVSEIKSIKKGKAVEPYWNYMIHLETPDRLWLLNADSEDKRQEWLNMLDEGKKTINYDQNASLFTDIQQKTDDYGITCKTNQRIKYVLELYQKWCQGNKQWSLEISNTLQIDQPKPTRSVSTGFKAAGSNKSKGIWEIINNDLKDYNNVHLLNDFNFLLEHYGSRRNKFLEFYKYMLGKIKEGPDVPPQESLVLMRNLRNRAFYTKYKPQRKMLFNDTDDVKEINTQNLLDRMWSFIVYSYNTVTLDAIEWGRIKDYDETEKLVTSKVMLTEKKQWMKKAKKVFRINERERKFMIDVSQYTQNMDTPNIEPKNKEKVEEIEEKKQDDDDNDDEFVKIPKDFNRLQVSFKTDEEKELEYFQFGGAELLYWEDCKDNEWFIPKQFENLKQELLNNNLCKISMVQWDDLYESATSISESKKATEYLSYDALGDNANYEPLIEKYGIYEYTPIKLNHICSILLWCNFYQLQQKLLSTYTPNINESMDDFKLRHGQYANWARYLRESCQVFGKAITEQDTFYYSINSDKVDFGKSLAITFNVPTAMTKSLFVAQSYFEFDKDPNKEKIGMLLSITKQTDAMAFYIDCGWISDFPQEQEVLILSIYPNIARIQSMVHISYKNNEILFNNYQYYMSAISDLEKMVNGNKASDAISRETKIALDEMIRYRFGQEPEDNDDDSKQEMKEVHITQGKGATSTRPEFTINISSAKSTDNIKKTEAQTQESAQQPAQQQPQQQPKKEAAVVVTNNKDNNNNDNKDNSKDNNADDKSTEEKPKEANSESTTEKKEDNTPTNGSKSPPKEAPPAIPTTPTAKVRPKGKLKGASEENIEKPKELVFKLKAKRRRKVPDYVKNMFDEYCGTVKQLNIDIARMVSLKHGYRAWKDLFMDDDDQWVKLDILVKLCPNITEIKVNYIAQAFTKKTVKSLIAFLNSDCVEGREINITIYRPESQSSTMFDDDSKDNEIDQDFTLKTALNKYLLKKSKVGANFKWFCRLNEDGQIPCIEIIRPHLATERNKDLSCILNESQLNIMMQLLQSELPKNKDISDKWYLNLLYRASRDGFESSKFHDACNGIGHTLSIIKSTNDHIFAAYTGKEWGRTGKWLMDKYAFLIPIKSTHSSSKPRIINIKEGHEQYGMYLQSNGGPGFGKGDIKILNKCDKSSRNTCNSNSFPFNMKPTNELVGGKGAYFKVADYEVFQIAFY